MDTKELDLTLCPKAVSMTPLIFISPVQEHFLEESLNVLFQLRSHTLSILLYNQSGLPNQYASRHPRVFAYALHCTLITEASFLLCST